MSKSSKALVVAVPAWIDQSVGKLRDLHGIAMNAAAQGVAAAIFAGLELRSVQAKLKKEKGGTFEAFLDHHHDTLGFSRRTAFKYTAVADGVKAKLIKQAPELARLLSLAPSQMTAKQAHALLKSLHKAADGESLNDLYADFGIVKAKHGHGLLKHHNKEGDEDETPAPVNAEQLFNDQLWLRIAGGGDGSVKTVWSEFDELFAAWSKPTKVGNSTVPLWQHGEKKKLAKLVEHLEHGKSISIQKLDTLIAQAREALKK